jgi:hypothetical protein
MSWRGEGGCVELRRVELSEPLLGIHPSFDGAVVLLDDVVQILHRPMPAATAENPFPLNSRDRRRVDGESSSNPGVKQPCALPESHELPGGISDTSAGRRLPVRC